LSPDRRPARRPHRLAWSAAVLLGGLSGCALEPVYGGGAGSTAATLLSRVEIAAIPDRAGFLVRQALRDRFGASADPSRFRLEVELDDQIAAFGVRGDNSAARERRTLRARYRLVDTATNAVLVDATASADAGIDRVSSNYAVVAAESTALERLSTELARQITARLAAYGRAAPPAPLAAPPR